VPAECNACLARELRLELGAAPSSHGGSLNRYALAQKQTDSLEQGVDKLGTLWQRQSRDETPTGFSRQSGAFPTRETADSWCERYSSSSAAHFTRHLIRGVSPQQFSAFLGGLAKAYLRQRHGKKRADQHDSVGHFGIGRTIECLRARHGTRGLEELMETVAGVSEFHVLAERRLLCDASVRLGQGARHLLDLVEHAAMWSPDELISDREVRR